MSDYNYKYIFIRYRPRSGGGGGGGGGGSKAWTSMRVLIKDDMLMSATLNQLLPDTVYEFMVLSRNRLGEAFFSDVVTARTKG